MQYALPVRGELPLADVRKCAWIWDERTLDHNPNLASVLSYLNIDRVFVNVGRTRDEMAIKVDERYLKFIKQAHASGIEVEALLANGDWARTGFYEAMCAEVRAVLEYNYTHPGCEFDALHLDIEPQTAAGYRGREADVLQEYLQNMRQLREELLQDDLRLVVDLPPHLNEEGVPSDEYLNFVTEAIEVVDQVVIMDYTRDVADFKANAAPILYAAAKAGKPVAVGCEFNPDYPVCSVSLLKPEESKSYFNEALTFMESSGGFDELAVHFFEVYVEYCTGAPHS